MQKRKRCGRERILYKERMVYEERMLFRKACENRGTRVYKSVCKEDGAGKGKKMAQGKIVHRLAFARLNAVRCGGGMTPFSHHTALR